MTIPPKSPVWAGLALLLGLNAIVFGRVLTFGFVAWDDDINITQNSILTEPWSAALVARLFDAEHSLRFTPLPLLLARGIRAAAGLDPAAWHEFNLLLHAGAAALFYVVLRQVLTMRRRDGEAPRRRSELAALFGAAIWSVHPLRAEPVAWATASTYPLSAVCVLGSFSCYLEAHRTATPRRRWLTAAWLLAVLGYASYPVTATYGLWLIAVDQWLLPAIRPPANSAAAREVRRLNGLKHACFIAPAVLAVAITAWSRFAHPGIFTAAPTIESVGLGNRILMALASLTFIAARLAWPVGLTPNVPPLVGSIVTPAIVLMALAAGAALLATWQVRRTRPLLTLAGLGFAALSLPCLGLTERPTWPVDRYCYIAHLPLIGALAAGAAGWANGGQRARSTAVMAAALTAGFAVAARAQSGIWRDTESLFAHMAAHPSFNDNPRQQGHIFVLWGRYEATNARPERAAEKFSRAQEIYLAAMRRAVASGRYAEALSLLTHVERHFGLTPTLRREKGAWLLRENRPDEALRELRVAAAELPDDARLRALMSEAEAPRGGPGKSAAGVGQR